MADYKRWRSATHVICNEPGCRKITKGKYCEEHQRKAKASPRTERDRFLDTAAWRRLSKWKLQETPWCEHCAEQGKPVPAVDVDHIKSRAKHPELALDPTNLQSLCKRCHSRKTGKGD
jgi:5-methylcytosine-specific restriction protein A